MEASAIQAVTSNSHQNYIDFFAELKSKIDEGNSKSISVNDGNFNEIRRIETVSFDGDTVFLCLDTGGRLDSRYRIQCDMINENIFSEIVSSIS